VIRFGDMLTAAAVLFGSIYAPAQAAPNLDFAVRVGCDFQQPERGLMDLHVLQGSTPLVLAMPKAGNVALTPDPDTSVRMIIGPTETGSIYAVRTNYAIAGGGYAIDWPTIGTNSSGRAWFYTLLFDRDGKTYWSGSGALYIDASGYTGPDGVEWIEYTTPNTTWQNILGDDPSANAALKAYIESQLGSGEPLWIAASNRVLYVGDIAETAYGTNTNTAYRGDWGASVSNLAASAVQPADTNGWVVSSHSGLATEAQAGQIATNVASGYLPLAGHNGSVVLGTSIRGYGATTNVGPYGFAAGSGTSAAEYGFAAGKLASAGNAGFAAGSEAKGADGSFVFADNSTGGMPFSRTNYPNSFSLRVAGGIYAEIGTNVFAVSNAVTMNGVELGAGDAIQTASIAALADGVATIDLGSNWCWRLDASGDITAINFSTAGLKEGAMNANSVKGILLEVSRGSSGAWAWGGHLSHITNTAPPVDAVSHLLLIGPSQDVTGTNGWAVY
jgi:hypothetical protein